MSNVARGKLKLKKPMVPSEVSKSKVTKSKDKRDKKSKKEKSRKREEKKPKKEETEWEGLKVGMDPTLANMTPAERAYELAQRERKRKRLENMTELSHEEKITKFNTYLSKLSEHYDIPKVGPG